MSTAALTRVGWWLFGIGIAWLGSFLVVVFLMPEVGDAVFMVLPEIFGIIFFLGYCPCGPLLIWAGFSLVLGCYFSERGKIQFSLATLMVLITLLCVVLGAAVAVMNAISRR